MAPTPRPLIEDPPGILSLGPGRQFSPPTERVFTWNGCFDILPANSTELLLWLGLDGSDSGPDIGDSSHFWLTDDGAEPPDDEGTLNGGGTDFDFAGVGSPAGTDPCIGLGNRVLSTMDDINSRREINTIQAIPSPMDGTRSFIAGIILIPVTENPGGAASRAILGNRNNTGTFPGWQMFTFEGNGRPGFIIDWGATDDALNPGALPLDAAMVPGEPELILVNADFDSLLMKVVTSRGSSSQAFTDQGTFNNTVEPLHLGRFDVAAWSAYQYNFALVFTLGYSDLLDAQLSEANVTRFKKFSNGFFPL